MESPPPAFEPGPPPAPASSNVLTWAACSVSAVLGMLMLSIGLVVGYASHPLISAWLAPTATATLVAPTATVAATAAADSLSANQRAELMKYVVEHTRHFQGSANAPVTLVEFGDFQ